jgi:exonuclease SbcC
MILTRIQIENYKQYQGNHDIDIPAQATIGVIGENGTGKTTLFEAIEWCLYSPRAISPSDVRPRGFSGHTSVIVHLESVDGTQQFIVERVLKRTPSANIYRVHPGGDIEPIVQGTRQVSDYVATKLIGLSHTAFTATFFTRQKELHLFGDHTPGKRREEVGRLLGLETIRTAQKSIIADRSKAASEAKAIRSQYERESQGRDFTAELATIERSLAERTAQLSADAHTMATCEAACVQAETRLGAAQARRDRDGALAQELGRHDHERRGLAKRLAQIRTELDGLASRETERTRLLPTASRLPALRDQVAAMERERSRFEQRRELERTIRDCQHRHLEINGAVRDVVSQVIVPETHTGWIWSADDALDTGAGIRRLLSIVESVNLPALEHQDRQLHAAHRAAADLAIAQEKLQRYQQARNDLDKDERALVAEGEPGHRIPGIDREREQLLHDRTVLHARRTALEDERDRARLILRNLDEQRFGDDCPTCGRPFSEGDVAIVATAIRQRVDDATGQITAVLREARTADSGLASLEARRKQVFADMEALDALRKRIQNSETYLEAQRETTGAAAATLDQALAEAGLTVPPTDDQITVAEQSTVRMRSLVGTRTSLMTSIKHVEHLDVRQRTANQGLDALGTIAFDPDIFERIWREHQEADRAVIAIGQIDQDLARKPDLETELGIATERIAELDSIVATITDQRAALGFDPEELATAQAGLQAARDAERAAVARFHQARTTLRETELQRESIERERQRLKRLAETADARQSEADHLEFMAREFTEFERFAAGRKRPILSEYTSHLVNGITDGRYDRVDFDHDFGIIVYDGADQESSYAVDTFSGGERDAITLAARIALSQMIGRQAANPPGFLVLDEVFGSLDADRRSRLLDMLGSISATFHELRQVFIISHVDDVRTSPVLDELWRIEETAEGSSAITSLGPGAEIDTL